MTDVAQRINLLKENKDCTHCCGDHKSEDCRKKDRICGGIKEGRGCSKQHKVHELFCSGSKLCMVVLHAKSTSTDSYEDGVVLCIMNVRIQTGRIASTFWDTGRSSNFFRDQFAKHCGFCLLYTSPSPRDRTRSRMPSSA